MRARVYNELYDRIQGGDRSPRRRRCALPGGLCILGTERHDSRRIDNQLRGRAGRQGDPGDDASSMFRSRTTSCGCSAASASST